MLILRVLSSLLPRPGICSYKDAVVVYQSPPSLSASTDSPTSVLLAPFAVVPQTFIFSQTLTIYSRNLLAMTPSKKPTSTGHNVLEWLPTVYNPVCGTRSSSLEADLARAEKLFPSTASQGQKRSPRPSESNSDSTKPADSTSGKPTGLSSR
ncbi:Protein of unknown function [Pyronema omphalodes CBS 100304]|uniref:Uncharacterized protein n=1 Tax=Pyronema omphalodes (strain CBS 100304) TaxID=1076935 RepID=U4KZU9_PYROM|nr:Protein of unknown function [Pyronema omphalodes CBS 100304]